MNKYQRQRSKEIKAMMAQDRFGRATYRQARRAWNFLRRIRWCSPCEDCDNSRCNGPYKVIAYCLRQR